MAVDRKDIVARLRQLPSLPSVMQELIASFNNDNLNTAALADKIAQDLGLSAKVLRVANSAFYGLPRQVGSIQDATMVLGFDCVRSFVLSAGVAKMFPPVPGSLFDRQEFWKRCYRVAVISKALARHLRQDPEVAFTAGMFHDVGQLVLDLCIPEQFSILLQQQAASSQPLVEIERSVLGFDHSEIGADVIRLWNFPPEIEQTIRYWQQPERQTTFAPLLCVVRMAVLLESGVSVDELMAELPNAACGRMQITQELIEMSLPQANELQDAANLAVDS